MDFFYRITAFFSRQEGITRRNAAFSRSHRAINGRLINPFARRSRVEMTKLVKEFHEETELDITTDLLMKGALLAQDENAFSKNHSESDSLELNARELEALEYESKERYNQPFQLYALIGACSAGAAVQGWDEAVANQVELS